MPTTLQPTTRWHMTRWHPIARTRHALSGGRRRHGILCGCGRTTRLRRHQQAAPALTLTTIPALITVIAAGLSPTTIAIASIATAAAITHHLRTELLIAELTGTGFCPACTHRAQPAHHQGPGR